MNAGFFFQSSGGCFFPPKVGFETEWPPFLGDHRAYTLCVQYVVTTRTNSCPYPHETARAAKNVPHNSRSSTLQLSMKKNHQAFEEKAANSTNFVVRTVLIGGIGGMGNFRPISYFFPREVPGWGKKGRGKGRQAGEKFKNS